MEVLCWRNTGRLDQVMNRVEEFLARAELSLEDIKRQASSLAKRVAHEGLGVLQAAVPIADVGRNRSGGVSDRKSTRLNSSHVKISYAVFCLKKKKSTHVQ